MAEIAPRLATPPHPLSLAKASDLQLTPTCERPRTMPGEMLAPHTNCSRALHTGSLHPLDLCESAIPGRGWLFS